MKYTSAILFSLFFFVISCDTEQNLGNGIEQSFIKYYGGDGNQEGADVELLADGGFLLFGRSTLTDGNRQMLLIRTDQLGNERWSKIYGGQANESAADLEINEAGEIFMSANLTQTGQVGSKILILKTDKDGALKDSVTLGEDGVRNTVNDILVANNGDLLIIGTIENTSNGSSIFFKDRLTSTLDRVPLWSERPISSGNRQGQYILEENNGELIYLASSDEPAPGTGDEKGVNFYATKVDDLGSLVSFEAKFYGNSQDQFLSGASRSDPGRVAMIGSTVSENGFSQLFVVLTRQNLTPLFEVELSNPRSTEGVDVTTSQSGDVLILGNQIAGTTNDIYLAALDDRGNMIRSETFGGSGDDAAAAIKELPDGSIVIAGTVELESQRKMVLIKTTDNGNF